MSTQISTAFVKQYSDNIMMLVQQMGSRLRGATTLETGKRGEEVYMEQLGATAAQLVTSRHADSPLVDTPHSRRRVTPKSFQWGDLIDDQDKLRMLIDPASSYAQNAAMAMGRSIDDEIISALTGTAQTGVDGSTSTTLPAAQKVAVNSHAYGLGTGDKGLTISKLLEAKKILGAADADDYDLAGNPNIFCVVNSKQLAHLLSDMSFGSKMGNTDAGFSGINALSGDYNSVRGLVTGEIDTFMGVRFIRTERLGTDSNSDEQVVMFHRAGIGLCVWDDIKARVTERADKRFATYVYFSMTVGSTRLEEERVVEIACDPS